MAQPDRKRDRFKNKLGKLFALVGDDNTPGTTASAARTTSRASVSTPSTPVRRAMLAVKGRTLICVSQALKNEESSRVETIASIRTVLDLSEKVLDGCPIWGPKAAVAAASQALKTVQVSIFVFLCNYLTPMLARRHSRTSKTSIVSWRRCRRQPKCLLRPQQYFQPLLLSSCALGYQNMWSMCAYFLFRRSSR
jgi:hypothetical protein